MVEKRQRRIAVTKDASVSEALDSLNAELRRKGARSSRRQIEATVEKEAKRRRNSEKPVSAGFKKT